MRPLAPRSDRASLSTSPTWTCCTGVVAFGWVCLGSCLKAAVVLKMSSKHGRIIETIILVCFCFESDLFDMVALSMQKKTWEEEEEEDDDDDDEDEEDGEDEDEEKEKNRKSGGRGRGGRRAKQDEQEQQG